MNQEINYIASFSLDPEIIDLPSLARLVTTEQVTDFLTKIGLPQYAEDFKTCDVSGDFLLEADLEILSDLGVSSPLHQMKIMQLFRRELQGIGAKYSTEHLKEFLIKVNLAKYASNFEEHGIDGDMVLEVEEGLMKSVLKEIGVISAIHRTKILFKFQKFADEEQQFTNLLAVSVYMHGEGSIVCFMVSY